MTTSVVVNHTEVLVGVERTLVETGVVKVQGQSVMVMVSLAVAV